MQFTLTSQIIQERGFCTYRECFSMAGKTNSGYCTSTVPGGSQVHVRLFSLLCVVGTLQSKHTIAGWFQPALHQSSSKRNALIHTHTHTHMHVYTHTITFQHLLLTTVKYLTSDKNTQKILAKHLLETTSTILDLFLEEVHQGVAPHMVVPHTMAPVPEREQHSFVDMRMWEEGADGGNWPLDQQKT